jgi:hypothetical protein
MKSYNHKEIMPIIKGAKIAFSVSIEVAFLMNQPKEPLFKFESQIPSFKEIKVHLNDESLANSIKQKGKRKSKERGPKI